MSRFALALVAIAPLAACKKPVSPVGPMGDAGPPPAAAVAPEPAVAALARNFERVHFAYDSAAITPDTRAALAENARILGENPGIQVEIQGHCDERGTTDYNLALGQKRAAAVRDQLAAQGVAPGRLPVVSFGEERPLDGGEGEVAWARNRRAEFRILSGDGLAQGTTR